MKKNIFWILFFVLSGMSISYLYVSAINVYIKTNSTKEELFLVDTSINYNEILTSSTRGRVKRLVKSNSVQRIPVQLDNIVFFSHIFANVYHPDYVFQQKQYAQRSVLWAVDFPAFTAKAWRDVMADGIKIRISRPPEDLSKSYMWSQAIQSGELIRVSDVLGHLILFKREYMPLFLQQGSKKELRQYLPHLEAIVTYVKANLEVNHGQLDEYDQTNLEMMDTILRDIDDLTK